MRAKNLLLIIMIPLLLSSCSWDFYDDMFSSMNPFNWFDDDEEVIVQNKPASSSGLKYVTVNIKEKIAVKIADPLGARQTGVGCALWKSNSGETGKCCWNSKGQCYCPCPE